MMVKNWLKLLFFCALPFGGNAQSFEWESEPEIGIHSVDFTKMIETDYGDFLMVGDKNGENMIYKFNDYGKLQWQVRPKIPGRWIEDIVSFDHSFTYFMIGGGLPFPERTNLYQIDYEGKFLMEKVIFTYKYTTRAFCNKLYKNTIVTGGYGFTPQPQVNPLLEFRSLKGDTIGKFEYKGDWYSKVRKVYLINNDSAFLLFCSYNGYGLITNILINTKGDILKSKYFGNGIEKYEIAYYDLVEKDSTYYMLINAIFWGNSNKGGDYVYRFNSLGDSIGMTRLEGRYNSIDKTLDNGLVLAGKTLLKLDSNFQVEWEKPFKEGVQILSVGASKTGCYFGSGRRFDKYENKYRTYVFKTNLQGDIETNNQYPAFEIYPNPFTDKINLELTFGEHYFVNIYDLQGKKCLDFEFTGSNYLNVAQLPIGIYILTLFDKNKNTLANQKIVKFEY